MRPNTAARPSKACAPAPSPTPGPSLNTALLWATGPAATDIGPALVAMVASIDVWTARAEAATATITFDDRRECDGNFMLADAGVFNRWLQVTIGVDFQTHVEEVFRGRVTELKPQLPQNGGEAKLVVELQNDGVALSRELMRRIWGEDAPMTDNAILTELLAPLGLSVAVGSGDGQSSHALSQGGPAITLLRDRARANGYEIILTRGEVWFGKMRLDASPQETMMAYAGAATNFLSLNVSDAAIQADQVGFEHAPRTEGADPMVDVVGPALRLLGRTAVTAEGTTLGTPSVTRVSHEGDETEAETRARAVAMANDGSMRIRAMAELDGTLCGQVLLPALPVRIEGVGTHNGGLYYVVKVTQAFTPDGYRQQFELIRSATGDADSRGPGPLSQAMSAIVSLF